MKLPDKDTLKEKYESYSDEQLMEILQNRNEYQEQAIEVAVDIALKRNLIASRQDLKSGKFESKKDGWSLFPRLRSAQQVQKTSKSIIRILYLLTLFPVIAAILNHASGKMVHVAVYCGIALIWGLLTWFVAHKQNHWLLYFHFALIILFLAFSVSSFTTQAKLHLFIYALFFFLITYLLMYLMFIINNLKKANF